MEVVHRAQLLLEDWHYQRLKARAEREGRSLSELMREILDRHLQPSSIEPGGGLESIEGAGADGEIGGRDHDRVLYSGRTKRP